MVDQWHQKEIIRYCNYMFQLSLPNRNEKVEKTFVWLSETHFQLFFFYIANKVLKIQQLSKWLLNLCCPHHVASRLSEVAIQN